MPTTPNQVIERVLNYGKRAPEQNLVKATSSDQRYVTDFKELDKGCLLYLLNEAEPMKFCTFTENQVRTTMMFKRFIPQYLRFVKSQSWLGKLVSAISLKVAYPFYRDYFYWFLTDTYRDVDRYCDAVRELYRVLPWEKEREMICAILEHDTGYRWIFQDIVSILDKEQFEKNPHKEIARLFNIAISRSDEGDAKKFKNIYKVLEVYLRINRKLLVQLKKIVRDIDLDAIKPSKEDVYWMYWLKPYNCFGLPLQERLNRYNQLKNASMKAT